LLKERLDLLSNTNGAKKAKKSRTSKLSDGDKYQPGVGLAEICKNSSGKLIYEFRPIGHSLSFFSLKVSL
jgi:hypothetical protein